ncbi:GEM-like protein 1 [Hibiscus syriacus]|uniref:GEM-like protein 1 n=1 Tax=Hibiscus syriacus TaxID=106335 RepID=A0A6A3BTX7_HIBSY|nr:GEM-like protein 1 [Hibiscus syriacus]
MNSNHNESQPNYPILTLPSEDHTNTFHQPSAQEIQPQMQDAAAPEAAPASNRIICTGAAWGKMNVMAKAISGAFCSDRPLSFTAPSGQETWSYYKVMIPLSKVGTVNPVMMRENPSQKYVQVVTVDGHDFWYMGFVNYEKACKHLSESVSSFIAVQPPSVA